jgi:transcriptional regulator with XRE-family HTH domain
MPKRIVETACTPEDQPLRRKLGERIRRARLAAGLTQTELGQRIGYAAATAVSKLEHGMSGLDVLVFARICKALKVEPDTLLRGLTRRRK